MKNQVYLLALLFIACSFFLPSVGHAQLKKSEMPKETLQEKKPNTPRQATFTKDKLIVKTDPNKRTGIAYQVEYKIVWVSATTFNLTSPKETQTNMDIPDQKPKGPMSGSDFFGYSYMKNWSLTLTAAGEYTLESSDTKDYRWVFLKM